MRGTNYWMKVAGRRVRRRTVLGAATAGAAALALGAAGCGDDDGGGAKETSQGTAAAAGQVKRGGVLQFLGSQAEFASLDPHLNSQSIMRITGPGMAWSRLIKLKTGEDVPAGTLTPVSDLASAWEQPDDTTTIFRLRKGVKFHNKPPVNGREFKADDVVYSFNRQRDLKITAGNLGQAESWTATDPYTVTMRTKVPDADFILGMTDSRNNIIPRETVELKGDLKEGPVVGTGPWVFEQWVRGSHVLMSRNPDYFITGIPYADSIRFQPILDASLMKAAFRNQQIFDFGGSGEDIAGLQREIRDLVVSESRQNSGGSAVMINVDLPPMGDNRLRQAIMRAINRQQIVDSIGTGWLGTGIPVPSFGWVLPQAEVNKTIGYDVAAAKALLSQAGVSNLRVRAPVFSQPEWVAAAELAQAFLKVVGIDLSLEPVDGATWVARGNNNLDREMALGPQVSGIDSTTAFLLKVFHSQGTQNGQHLKDTQLDRLIEQQGTILKDVEARKRLVLDIQRRIHELAAQVPMYTTATKKVRWPFLKNYTVANNDYSRWEVMWLDR